MDNVTDKDEKDIIREEVKKFLLGSVNNKHFKKQDKTIGKYFTHTRNLGLFLGSVFLLGFFQEGLTNSSIRYIFYLLVLLTIATGILMVRIQNQQVFGWRKLNKLQSNPYIYPFFGIMLAVAGLIIWGLEIGFDAIMVVGGIPTIIISTMMVCSAQYNIYLLQKYCPELKDIKATEINK